MDIHVTSVSRADDGKNYEGMVDLLIELNDLDDRIEVYRRYKDEKERDPKKAWKEFDMGTVEAVTGRCRIRTRTQLKISEKGDYYVEPSFRLPWDLRKSIGLEAARKLGLPIAESPAPPPPPPAASREPGEDFEPVDDAALDPVDISH